MMNIFVGLVLIGIVVVAVWAMINRQENPAKVIEEVAKEVKPTPCGCGRSSTGNCVGLHKLTEEEWAVSDKNQNKKDVKKRKPRVPKDETPKEVIEPKKPRAPRKKKAE